MLVSGRVSPSEEDAQGTSSLDVIVGEDTQGTSSTKFIIGDTRAEMEGVIDGETGSEWGTTVGGGL